MKPIPFSTPMVQAILDGRKTQTRRVIQPQPIKLENIPLRPVIQGCECQFWGIGTTPIESVRARYQPGDILYVRETWSFWPCWDCDIDCNAHRVWHRDDDGCFVYRTQQNKAPHEDRWRPSIFMPKAAARLFLRIIDVRAEPLLDITTEDICNEGIWVEPPPIVKNGASFPDDFERRTEAQREDWYQTTARATYIGQCDHIAALHREWERLWDGLNKKRGFGCDNNPWVFAYNFERISQEEAEQHG